MPAEDFFRRVRAQLALDMPTALTDPNIVPSKGDHELNREMQALWAIRPIRPAAVLVPVVERAEPTVLLTQRSAHLPDHAGQISFPGGKIDAMDESPMAAALREAEEEVGLERRFIEPMGYLDLYMTTQGYRIVPVVARIAPEYVLSLNRSEVDDAFEVPLSFLMEPGNHEKHSRDWQGMTRYYFAMPFEQRHIWGVTAGILRNLYERIYAG
jgi:8-oxo-dGTP pyrophosphatase MutT (NUDIX family)